MGAILTRHRYQCITFDELHQCTVQHIAHLATSGYVVAVRRTPDDLDAASLINIDLVLCDRPPRISESHFEDRIFWAQTAAPTAFHQFHIIGRPGQLETMRGLIGRRVELYGISSVVCWENPDTGVAGHLCCFDPAFLDMMPIRDADERERGRHYMRQGMTPCHVLSNVRITPLPSMAERLWGFFKSAVGVLKWE